MQSESCQWQVTGELGRGSYGSVYCLKYLTLHSKSTPIKYALKLLEQSGRSAQDTDVACKELRIMASLSHPSIVALVDAFQMEHRLLLMLELCEGGDLRSFLDGVKGRRQPKALQGSGVEEPLAVRWTQQLASGLHYLHHKKILHRDLKPQNIFLKDKFTLKIGDLGIARQLVYTREMAATLIGTPLYFSPEIYQGIPYSYKADVWSLGCCIYEMLTLEYAFHAPSRFELMGKVIKKKVLPLPRCYSGPLQTLVLNMLCKEPDDRPSASDILQSVQAMDGVSPQPETKPWEQEDLDTDRLEKPGDRKSLQLWRLEIAQTLKIFLNKKWEAQSAELAAAMGKKLSLGSIKDIDGSGSKVSSARDRRRERHKVSSSKLNRSNISDDDNEGAELSQVATFSSDESTSTLSSSQSSSKATIPAAHSQKIQADKGQAQEDLFSAGRVRTEPNRSFLNGHGESHSNESYSNVDTRDAGFSEVNSQPRHIQVGKFSVNIKSRPLPYPKISRDVSDNGDLTGFSTEQSDTMRSLQYTDFSDSGLQPEEGSSNIVDRTLSSTEYTNSTETSQSSFSTLDGSGHLSTLHSDFPQYEQLQQTRLSPDNAQQCDNNEFPISGDSQEIHRAYANKVIEQVRGKLMTLAYPSTKAADNPGHRSDRTQVSSEESGSKNSMVQADDHMEEEKGVQENGAKVKKTRGKKKRNFLREMSNKETNETNSAVKASPAQIKEKEKPSVTLFTRAQRVTFSNLRDDQLDFSNDLDRLEPMTKEMSVLNLQAAVSTAVLLAHNPELLQFQLRELLGRENYKKYAADIVDMAIGRQLP